MVLAALREATASLHHDVESRVDFLSPHLTIPRYICILQAFYAFFHPVEAAMDAHCPSQFRSLWQGRRRADSLVEDLKALNSGIDPRPRPFSLPDVSEPPLWMGALYVLEGSALGGQVISRHLEEQFGWRQGCGYSFLLGHGGETRARWRQVSGTLEANTFQANLIVSGAHQTFNLLSECLSAYI